MNRVFVWLRAVNNVRIFDDYRRKTLHSQFSPISHLILFVYCFLIFWQFIPLFKIIFSF